MDMDGNMLLEITVQDCSSNDIAGLEWIDNDRIAVAGHVNPSTNQYFVFDAATGKELSRYAGGPFVPLPDGSGILYGQNMPHWRPRDIDVHYSLMVEDQVIYTVPDAGCPINEVAISLNMHTIALYVRSPLDDEGSISDKLVVAEYDKEARTVKSSYEVEIPYGVGGYLSFDEAGNVCFVNKYEMYTLSGKDGSFIVTEILTDMRDMQNDPIQHANLQSAVTKYFGDKTLEDIFDITWIP